MMPTYTFKICQQCNTEFKVLPRDKNRKFCTYDCSHQYVVDNSKIIRHTNCINCDKLLDNYQLKFCSKSCAAITNNKFKTFDNISKQIQSVKEFYQNIQRHCDKCNLDYIGCVKPHKLICTGIKHRIKRNKSNQPKLCASCNINKTEFRRKYCIECKPNINYYRTLTKFTFNVFEYPDKFDLSLIKIYGWYSPNGYKRRNKTPNLSGVSRDHLYNVIDGFKNKIDPILLAHPANCSIMIHNGPNGNNSKKKSSITLDELLERIKIWDYSH